VKEEGREGGFGLSLFKTCEQRSFHRKIVKHFDQDDGSSSLPSVKTTTDRPCLWIDSHKSSFCSRTPEQRLERQKRKHRVQVRIDDFAAFSRPGISKGLRDRWTWFGSRSYRSLVLDRQTNVAWFDRDCVEMLRLEHHLCRAPIVPNSQTCLTVFLLSQKSSSTDHEILQVR